MSAVRQRTRGRPCGLTEERQAILLSAIKKGLPLKDAASIAGISYASLNRWQNKGEEEDAPPEFRNFCNHLREAQSVAVDTLLSQITNAARKDWKAAAWILERRHPEAWGRTQRLEHAGPGGLPIATVALSPSEARQYISDDALHEIVRETIREEDSNER